MLKQALVQPPPPKNKEIENEINQLFQDIDNYSDSVDFNVNNIISENFLLPKDVINNVLRETLQFVHFMWQGKGNTQVEKDKYKIFILVLWGCCKILQCKPPIVANKKLLDIEFMRNNLAELAHILIVEHRIAEYSYDDAKTILDYARICLFFRKQLKGVVYAKRS